MEENPKKVFVFSYKGVRISSKVKKKKNFQSLKKKKGLKMFLNKKNFFFFCIREKKKPLIFLSFDFSLLVCFDFVFFQKKNEKKKNSKKNFRKVFFFQFKIYTLTKICIHLN